MLTLNIQKRDPAAAAEKARAAGLLPAVFYGPKEASTPISVAHKDFKSIWAQAGESSVVILKDGATEHEALIHEVDIHPLTGEPRHADFYVVEKGKKVRVHVPLVFTGVSPAVKDLAGILVKVMREIEVEAAPRDLPRELIVDISALVALDSVIHAKDIKVSPAVSIITDPDEVVASITVAREEPVEAPTAIDMSAIEVETKGKKPEEGADAAPAADAKKADAKKADKK